MDKMFKSLRNSEHTGPYTFGELVHLGLQPFHLTWANGRRDGGCRRPSEMDASKPFHDLPPGESLTLIATRNKKAASATSNRE